MSDDDQTYPAWLTKREAMAIRVALIFGDPKVGGAKPDPVLESAKLKLKMVEAGR